MKVKVKPSARMKKRYLLLEGGGKAAVERAILDGVGAIGFAKASPKFIDKLGRSGQIVLAINRKSVDEVRACFELASGKIKVVKVSGTLKGLGVR